MNCSSRTILFHIFGSAGSGFEKIRWRDTGYAGKQERDGGMRVPCCAPSFDLHLLFVESWKKLKIEASAERFLGLWYAG